jgi:small-conductance mechanosensitive channel
MNGLDATLSRIEALLKTPLLTLNQGSLTVWSVLYTVLLVLLLIFAAGWLNRFLVHRLLARRITEIGTRDAIAKLVQYVIVVIGFFIILQTSGIDMSALTVLLGTLGIGVGFGLQHLAANMMSGLMILIERPIKVGDRIEVGGVHGDVVRISLRATTVVTNENISIIIPNSEFTSTRVVNWSYTSHRVRLDFPVGVAYG